MPIITTRLCTGRSRHGRTPRTSPDRCATRQHRRGPPNGGIRAGAEVDRPDLVPVDGDGVIGPNAHLPLELVALLYLMQHGAPAAQIAQRCEEIAQAYRERPAPNQLWDIDRREIVTLLTGEAERFRRQADADVRVISDGGGDYLHNVS